MPRAKLPVTVVPRGKPPSVKRGLAPHTVSVRDIIAAATEKMGGVNGLVKWAQQSEDNERIFWSQIFPKLLPIEARSMAAQGGHAAVQVIVNTGVPRDDPVTVAPAEPVEDAEYA